MPEYTQGGIQYPIAGDLIKESSVAAKLARDMKSLATTADSAARSYAEDSTWMKDVVLSVGDSLDALAGVSPGTQVKAKIPNAAVAAGITGWPAGLTLQGAVVVSYGLNAGVSLQQLQTYSNTDPRLFIRTSGQAWLEVTRQYQRAPVQTVSATGGGAYYLQRSGNEITVTLNGVIPPPGSNLLVTLPVGYKNEIRNAYGFTGRTGTGLPASFEVTNYSEIKQYTTHETALYGVIKFQTNEGFPA